MVPLVENISFIIDSLENKFSTDKALELITMSLQEVWNLWKSILSTVRASHKITREEIDQLNSDISAFCNTYMEIT